MSRKPEVPRPVFDRGYQLAHQRFPDCPATGWFAGLRDAFRGFYPPSETNPNTKETQ